MMNHTDVVDKSMARGATTIASSPSSTAVVVAGPASFHIRNDKIEPRSDGRIVTIRPGRSLFVRSVVIGGGGGDDSPPNNVANSACVSSTSGTRDEPHAGTAKTSLTFVFVNGLCSTEQHYHLLLHELHQQFVVAQPTPSHDETDANNTDSNTRTIQTIRCVLYDWAGCGQSPIGNNGDSYYSHDESMADLEALLRREHQENDSTNKTPIIVVGHSYAANLILPLFLQRNTTLSRVTGIILLSCGIRTPSLVLPDGGLGIMRHPFVPLMVLKWFQPSMTRAFVQAALYHPANIEDEGNNPTTELDVYMTHICNANDMRIVRAYHRNTKWFVMPSNSKAEEDRTSSSSPSKAQNDVSLGRQDTSASSSTTITTHQGKTTDTSTTRTAPPAVSSSSSFSQWNIPTCVMHGLHDLIIPFQAGKELAQALSMTDDNFHGMDNASHMIMLEQPHQVAQIIVQFVAQHLRTAKTRASTRR